MTAKNPDAKSAELQKVTARIANFLDCIVGRECKGRRRRIFIITFGGADGAVDSVALTPDEGYRLMRTLLSQFKVNGAFGDELSFKKTFCIPHSVGRAKIDLQRGLDRMFEQLVKDIPEIAEYVRAELGSLQRTLRRCCRAKTSVNRIVERMREALLIAVDAARIDT